MKSRTRLNALLETEILKNIAFKSMLKELINNTSTNLKNNNLCSNFKSGLDDNKKWY